MSPGLRHNHVVDLEPGIYSAKQLLNLCCVANPTLAYSMSPAQIGTDVGIYLNELYLDGLTSPPSRAAALKFWEIEIGKAANGMPGAGEVAAALCDASPRKRWAARTYLAASARDYGWKELMGSGVSPEKSVWTVLGIEAVSYRGYGYGDEYSHYTELNFRAVGFTNFLATLGFANYCAHLEDPGVALLASLELASHKEDSSFLDGIVSKHKFSEAEIAPLLDDIYRMARGFQFDSAGRTSHPVLDKLKRMKLDVPELSPERLRELEDT
jgi:hypothetical protein